MTRRSIDNCRKFALVALAGVLWFGWIGTSLAQSPGPFVLKFNHVLSPKEPFHDGFNKWAQRVASAPRAA